MAFDDQNDSNRSSNGIYGAGSEILSREKLHSIANDAFEKSANAMSNAELGKTTKLFGLFEVDAGLGAYLTSMYNIGANVASNYLQPHTYDLTKKYAHRWGMEGQGLNRLAAATTIATTVATKAGLYITPLFDVYKDQRKQRIQLAHELAPVLDDLKGKHSVGSLYSVKASDNEVIYVQRKRMGRIAHSQNLKAIVDLGINAGPNLATDLKEMAQLSRFKGNALASHEEVLLPTIKDETKTEVVRKVSNKHEMKNMLGGVIGLTSGQVADRVAKTNEMKLQKTLQPYSAYEMIRELDAQVSGNPKASSFRLPKPFASTRNNQKSLGLEEYVMCIFIQHQKDMADISPEHTEIREALKDDLAAIAKPIADSIRKGDMSALSLVRLVGEGKIIKNKGRALASPDVLESLIVKDAPKEEGFYHISATDYYKEASFTRDDLKTAFKSLDDEEKMHLASMVPDSALKEIGISASTVKNARAMIAKDFERMVADAVIGLEGKSDEELKNAGLAQKEIDFLHVAFKKIEHEGLKAVHDLRSGPSNDKGIERLVTNVAVEQAVKGNKGYLEKIIKEGHTKFEDVASERVSDQGRGARKDHGHESRHDEDDRRHDRKLYNSAEDAYNASEKPGAKIVKMHHEGHLNGRHNAISA